MNVGELMEALEGMPEDVEVRFAAQPSWPMQHAVYEALLVEAGGYEKEDGFVEEFDEDVLYLVDGGQLREQPYLPGAAQARIGW